MPLTMSEKQTIEYKSIRKIRTGDNGFRDLSVTCVALANAQGGTIFVGYEDKTREPLPTQHIDLKEINDTLTRLRGLCFNVGISASEIMVHPNGGEYFEIYIAPSLKSIATTSDAKIYIRIASAFHGRIITVYHRKLFCDRCVYNYLTAGIIKCQSAFDRYCLVVYGNDIQSAYNSYSVNKSVD